MSERLRRAAAALSVTPAWTITAAASLAYLIASPYSPDLAAADYRSQLFSHAGPTLWDNSWYGGHHLLAYSLLAPALSAFLGPRLLAALSMTAASALFAVLIAGRFSARACRLAAVWFALGASVSLLSSRVPFDLGLALGLAALLAAQRRRSGLAAALGVVCALASPVAGAFLALAFLACTLGADRRMAYAALTVAALAPIGLLAVAFPEGGTQPFVASAFYPALAGVLALIALIPAEQRVLRVGAVLYALALIGSYLLPTAVGGNADRLGSLAAGPIAACVLASDSARIRRRVLLVLAPALLYWQANAPVADLAASLSSPAVYASYYKPLLSELRTLDVGYGRRPARIEIVPTAAHWEARWVAPAVMLARGWERQLDRYRDGLFYDSSRLDDASYRAWLAQTAVSYVALPDAPLDYSAAGEAALLRVAVLPPYLREIWHSRHWRLYAVRSPTALAQAPATLTSVSSDSFTVHTPQAGAYTVLVHFSPYWQLTDGHGCVSAAAGDWTRLRVPAAGDYRVEVAFSLGRIVDHGPRCR